MDPGALRYAREDLLRLRELVGAPLSRPEVIRNVLDGLEYESEWRTDYHIRSVRSSLHSTKITCIDAAILSYGLLELLFGDLKRRLLAIHRRDSRGEECGHCVTLYFGEDGRVGAFSKSSFAGLNHRDPIYADETEIAMTYAEAYLAMGFQPLYFGVTTMEDVAPDLDWRYGTQRLNIVSERIQARYEYSFQLAR